MFIKGLTYPEQKVKRLQNLYRVGNYTPGHNILEILNNLVQIRIAKIKMIHNIYYQKLNFYNSIEKRSKIGHQTFVLLSNFKSSF